MTLNHVDNIESVASYMRFDFIGLLWNGKYIYYDRDQGRGRWYSSRCYTEKNRGSTGVIKIMGFSHLDSNKNVTYIITTAVSY